MNKKLIRKMQTASGGPLQLTPEEQKYLEWSKMTPELKREYRTNRAKTHLLSGPNITNFWEAFQTYIGNRDPENPHLQTGDVPNPGIKNPKDVIQLFRATGTSGKFKPSLDGTQEFSGQWFTDNIRKPLRYASSTFKKAKISKESNPVELQVVEIPASEINKYKASELLKGRTDIEYEPTEDFLIPLDYPRLKYPIEGLTGNLLLDMRLKLPIEKQGGKMMKKYQKGTINGGILPDIEVTPTKLYLETYYPGISKYPATGHSALYGYRTYPKGYLYYNFDSDEEPRLAKIDKKSSDAGYNFVTNNCADATRCALEAISGKKMNPNFFTTPGDVLDFFKENFDVRKSTRGGIGESLYYTNITPALLEIISKLLKALIEANRQKRQKERLLAKNLKGGKMNIIDFLKNGSNIHIKEENKGKFTSYCGGKVTDECILKGKNSSNPAIRKRATFASNARKWKHKSGGLIVKEFKLKLKFYYGGSVDWGSIASDILNLGILTAFLNEQITALNKTNNADLDKKYSLMIQSLLELSNEKLKEYLMNWVNNFRNGYTLEHLSPVTMKHFGLNLIGLLVGNAKDETSKLKRANDDAATSLKTANYVQLFGSVANTALNAFGLYMANRLKNTPTVLQTPVTLLLNTTPLSNILFNNPSLNDTLYLANNYNFV